MLVSAPMLALEGHFEFRSLEGGLILTSLLKEIKCCFKFLSFWGRGGGGWALGFRFRLMEDMPRFGRSRRV